MLLPSYVVDNGWMILTRTSIRFQSQMQPRYGLCKTCSVYGSNWCVEATLDAWEGSKTSTICHEAWHTIEDILGDVFDAITLVPHA